nr:hypothetical protein [Streptomyces caatingaensis]
MPEGRFDKAETYAFLFEPDVVAEGASLEASVEIGFLVRERVEAFVGG